MLPCALRALAEVERGARRAELVVEVVRVRVGVRVRGRGRGRVGVRQREHAISVQTWHT